MKVSIKDFQIIKSASLDFQPGLTLIIGESNNGKSAIFRAMKSCIYNEPGTSNVRIGCKNYLVGIENNNHKVILQKGENSLYLIDGQQYNKIGKTQLEEVGNALGLKALQINEQTEKINFWDQMEKPFLLDRNSSDLFRFIVDSGEDDNLNESLRAMVSDKNKLNTDKNLKEGSINTLKEQIDSLESTLAGSDDKIKLCEDVITYGPKTSKLLTIANIITNINKTKITIEETTNTINKEKTELKENIQKLNTLSYNISKMEQIKSILDKYNNYTTQKNTLEDELKNKVNYKTILRTLESNITKLSKVGELVGKMVSIKEFIDNNKVTKLEMNIGQDKVKKSDLLRQLLDRISNLSNQVSVIQSEIVAVKNEMKPFNEELLSFKVCPYCGQTLKEGGIHND